MTPSSAPPDQASAWSGRAAGELVWLTWMPLTALLCLALLAVLSPGTAEGWSFPLAAAGLAIGVPHGAVDHLVAAGFLVSGRRRAYMPLVLGAYLATAALAIVALLLVPTLALMLFLLLSAAHFGSAETAFAAERAAGDTPTPWSHALFSVTHGTVVVGLLLWARPADVMPLLTRLDAGTAQLVLRARPVGLALAAILVAVTVLVVLTAPAAAPAPATDGRSALIGRRFGWITQPYAGQRGLPLLELAALVGAFALAPPLAAFGVYFGAWHSIRHTGRLLDLLHKDDDEGWRAPAVRLARGGAVPAGIALAAVAGAALTRGSPILVEVAVVLALTFPHAGVVWASDLARGATASTDPPDLPAVSRQAARVRRDCLPDH